MPRTGTKTPGNSRLNGTQRPKSVERDTIQVKASDVEDLFDPKDYLSLYTKAFKTKLAMSALKGSDRIVARISRATGATFMAHGAPADYLLRNRDTVLPALAADTLDRFESRFKAINATLRQ